jgi:serine/threonine protein kinase
MIVRTGGELMPLSDTSDIEQGLPVWGSPGPDYEVLSVIGKGGMGVVLKARHRLMDRFVTIKIITSEEGIASSAAKRFLIETKTTANLDHPNIVKVYASGLTDQNRPFMVMEYLEGAPLDDLIAQSGPLRVDRFRDIFSQVLDGLQCAHQAGLVHRDIKPSNIFICKSTISAPETAQTPPPGCQPNENAVAKILDFGIVRQAAQSGESQHLTGTAGFVGTPAYASPEQCKNSKVDNRSDIYSLGCTMYECLTGSPPFTGETPLSIAYQHLSEAPRYFAEVNETYFVPSTLEAVVLKAMSKSLEQRQQTAAQLKREMLEAEEESPCAAPERIRRIRTRLAQQPDRAGKPVKAKTLTMILLAVLFLFGIPLAWWSATPFLRKQPSSSEPTVLAANTLRGKLHEAESLIHSSPPDYERAAPILQAIIESKTYDPLTKAQAHQKLSDYLITNRRDAEARAHMHEAAKQYRRHGDTNMSANLEVQVGDSLFNEKKYGEAAAQYRMLLANGSYTFPQERAAAFLGLARCDEASQKNQDEVESCLRKGIACGQQGLPANLTVLMRCREELGEFLWRHQKKSEALAVLKEGESDVGRWADTPLLRFQYYFDLASVYDRCDYQSEAPRLAKLAGKNIQYCDDLVLHFSARINVARMLARKDPGESNQYFQAALRDAERLRASGEPAYALDLGTGGYYASLDTLEGYSQARTYYERALQELAPGSERSRYTATLHTLCYLCSKIGDTNGAAAYKKMETEAASGIGNEQTNVTRHQ